MIINTVKNGDTEYPELLEHLFDPPAELFWKGASWSHFKNKPKLAIVGSRKCSSYGRACIEKFVSELAPYNVAVVSGLALGADSIAHRSALACKVPTIAVLPSPVQQVYPASHRQLAQNIVEQGGALVSEYTDGASIMKHQFIARNRIIAALADAVLIPEAAINSGSLHTARFALDIGRPVFVIPGNITSPLSAGTNNLIKIGAIPVTELQDILHGLSLEPLDIKQTELIARSEEELVILQLLRSGASEGAALQLQSKLSPTDYLQTMTMLELEGRIKPLGGDHWTIVK